MLEKSFIEHLPYPLLMKRCFVLICLLYWAVLSAGQNLVFNHLMTENGLSQNSIFSITQDNQGFMWYGSRYGLNRYDGYQFAFYKSQKNDTTTLSDDYITALFTDSKNTLWVGTANGLNRFNAKQHTFSRITLPQKGKVAHSYIRNIYQDKAQRLWLATNHGLYLALKSGDSFVPVSTMGFPASMAFAEILCVKQDSKGLFWVGTNRGLVRFALNGNKVSAVNIYYAEKASNTLSDNAVTDIVEDKLGQLWIGTESGGVNMFDRKTATFIRFAHGLKHNKSILHHAVRKMLLRQNGEIWIGTQEGLNVLDPVTRTFRAYRHVSDDNESLNQNSIYSLFEDKSGSIWIGTYYGGINVVYAHPTKFKRWTHKERGYSLGHNVISTIIPDGNYFWIGTEGGGLSYVNSNGQSVARYVYEENKSTSLGSNLVKIVYKDRAQNIWVGTHGGGLNLLDVKSVKSGNFKRFWIEPNQTMAARSEIVALLEDQQGWFWVGSQTGLAIFDKESFRNAQLLPLKLPKALTILHNKNVKVLYQDSRKDIWIGTTTGLYLYNKATQTLRAFTLPNASNSVNANANYFNCITEDSKGNIWVGLYYGGLAAYHLKSDKFDTHYTTKDGLSNNNVVGIIEDKQKQLWISTSNGLCKFDPQTRRFQNYTHADGLAADEFNYGSAAIDSKGEVFFGGYQGLTYFNPAEIGVNHQQSKMVFTKLLLFNTEVQIGDETKLLNADMSYTPKLTFASHQNLFTIQFALLNYIKSNKNRYAYKLEGINEEWINTTVPQATYTNLPSGKYNLLVKGANNDGVWSEVIAMRITILPPFYKTWWAFCIYALLIATTVFFITRFFYLRTLLIKDEELHQKKINFFTNVSHEIRTHLTLITVPIERLIEENHQDKKLSQQLVNVKSYAGRLLNLVSELMDFRKAETDHLKLHIGHYDMVAFLTHIMSAFKALAQKNNIAFNLYKSDDVMMASFDRLQMEKVLFNLISNAFKFTPTGGKINISAIENDNYIEIKVEDTGRGISPEYMDKLFTNFFQVDDYNVQQTGYGIGLALSKRIVELHKGTIKVSSVQNNEQAGNITLFTVTLPLVQNRNAALNDETLTTIDSSYTLQHIDEVELTVKNAEDEIESVLESVLQSEDDSLETAHIQQVAKEKVLLIEDNVSLSNMLKEILQQQYTVLVAANGKEGIEIAFNEIPDIIISDVMMPELGGLEVCGILKKDERTSHIPIILLTAKSTEEDEIQGLTYGADVYIAKPFSKKILLLNVQNLLHAQAVMREKFSSKFMLGPSEVVLENKGEQFLTKLIAIIETNMENEIFGVEMLADRIGMSYSVLNKKLKSLTNMSVNDFSKSIRLKRAAQLLKQKEFNVYEVGYMVGFSDRKYFSKEFKKQFGQTPSEYVENSSN